MYQYRSEANRFDRDFAFEITKKSDHSFFFKTKGKKRKCSITNYRSFAITTEEGKRLGTPRSGTDSNTAPFLTGKICSHDQRDRLVFDTDTVTTKTPPTIQ